MKYAARALYSIVLPLLVSVSLVVGCADANKNVSLRDPSTTPGNSNNPEQKPGNPVASPTPEQNNPDLPGEVLPEPTPIVAPSPEPVRQRVARFICESETRNSRSLNTLSGDAATNFMMPSLVPYIHGKPLKYSKAPVPLQSNGEIVTFIMRGQEDDFTPWKIYKATGNILDSRANLQVLSNYPGLQPKGGYAYENLKLNRDILGANVKRTSFLYPDSNGTYTWQSLSTGKTFTVPFNASSSFNPTFIGGDDYLRFDLERDGSGVLTQKLYHFPSKKVISLPAPADSRDSQLFSHVNGSQTAIFWIEGRPNGTWKIRTKSLSSSGSGNTIGNLPGNPSALRLPMTFIDTPSTTLLAYAEEALEVDKAGRTYLQTAALHLVSVNAKQLKITASSAFAYSEELKRTAIEGAVLRNGILGGVFYEPISDRLYSTNLAAGGLVSFDLDSKTWRTHGMIALSFGCFNPQWGVEVTHD